MGNAKYQPIQTDSYILKEIRDRVTSYFNATKRSKKGNLLMLVKGVCYCSLGIFSYVMFIYSDSWPMALLYFYLSLFTALLLAINIGHDAAHCAMTGKKGLDNFLFQFTFMLNGILPDMWDTKHTGAHHIFPNVSGKDSDMEFSTLIYLSPQQTKQRYHDFQHYYAPVLYLFFSLGWILCYDFILFSRLSSIKISWTRLSKLIAIKVLYLFVCLAVPLMVTPWSWWQLSLIFIVTHMVLSLFLSFTFFISHHVDQVDRLDVDKNQTIQNSWLRHQVQSTIDFHGQSHFANFIFGGFHAHAAHHLFPEICHVHYPKITSILVQELKKTDVRYKSLNYFHAMISHLRYLKLMSTQ